MRYVVAIVACAVALSAVVSAGAGAGGGAEASCMPRASKQRGEAATHARARKVVNRYALDAMRSCDGVEGMGVGAADGITRPDADRREHVIVVHLRDSASRPKRAKSIAGVTIRYVVTGEFRAL